MPAVVPPLAVLCIRALARFPDQLYQLHHRRVPASPTLLDALANTRDPCLWAALAQLVHPLPPDLHDHDLPFSHPALPLLQKIPDSPSFSLVTLLSLPNCIHLRDHDIANLRSLHRLVALDLRGCSISSYAITALTRGLATPSMDCPTRSGPWGIRLLSLHGCPNIDNDVLPVLQKFPLLSAIDLRFTRCTSTSVGEHLSPLGFRSSDNNSLFHPAPLSLALCSLEKVALTTSSSMWLYACPPQSVFRVHIDELNHLPSRTKKIVPVASSSTSRSTIQTTSSSEETVVFIPPLRKKAKHESSPQAPPSVSSATVSAASTSFQIDRSTESIPVSNVTSFYGNAPARPRKNILPLSALAVQSSESGKLDPLAIARSPPPWKILDTPLATSDSSMMVSCCRSASHNAEDSRRMHHPCWIGQTLSKPLKVDRARLHKRGFDAVSDMVHQFTSKRPKVESEFALAKTQAKTSMKSRNPFVRDIRSVFAEGSITSSEKLRTLAHESTKGPEPELQLRTCRSLPSQTLSQQGTNERASSKPLKPITSLKPPVLLKEWLPPVPQYTPRPRSNLKQTKLSFAREVE